MHDLDIIFPKDLKIINHNSDKTTIQVATGHETHFIEQSNGLIQYFNSARQQYDALQFLNSVESSFKNKTIFLTNLDVFMPIFTYVFGLARLGGNAGIVSTHRLDPQFYGLPANDKQLHNRLIKEIIHEFGHLVGLKHCPHFNCVMSSSSDADELDIKGFEYCMLCRQKLLPG